MKGWLSTLAILSILTTAASLQAAETKVGGRLFADWMMDLSNGADNANEFNVTRTYIDIKSKLSDYTSVRFTMDLRSIDDADTDFHGYTMILKYGYLNWSPKFTQNRATLSFGLHPTPYIDMMNKIWGRRYIEKTAGDKYKYLTTSDLGASLAVDFGAGRKYGFGSISVFNGTSYSDLNELNKQKDFNAYVFLTPFVSSADFAGSQFQAQIYTGTQNLDFANDTTLKGNSSDYNRMLVSFGGTIAYQDIFSVGGDANFYSEGQGQNTDDHKMTAHSVFGTLYFGGLADESSPLRTLDIFGRIDLVDPNTDVSDDGNTLLIAGLECAPYKSVKTSVNFRQTSYQDDTKDSKSAIFMNWLIQI